MSWLLTTEMIEISWCKHCKIKQNKYLIFLLHSELFVNTFIFNLTDLTIFWIFDIVTLSRYSKFDLLKHGDIKIIEKIMKHKQAVLSSCPVNDYYLLNFRN